jgi:glutamate formiminotransferase
MKELCEIVEDLNKTYRNPSVHERVMNRKSAEVVINVLFFNKKILYRFFEKIKNE